MEVTAEELLPVLRSIRSPFVWEEQGLHVQVQEALRKAGYEPKHEAYLSRGCRVDFLVGSIAIEIKKGKPDRTLLLTQIERYLTTETVTALIVVSEKQAALPQRVKGKPVYSVSLNRLWGVALP